MIIIIPPILNWPLGIADKIHGPALIGVRWAWRRHTQIAYTFALFATQGVVFFLV